MSDLDIRLEQSENKNSAREENWSKFAMFDDSYTVVFGPLKLTCGLVVKSRRSFACDMRSKTAGFKTLQQLNYFALH